MLLLPFQSGNLRQISTLQVLSVIQFDNCFLNLWIREVPFQLDFLLGLPRYVFPSSFQSVCDDKSGYDRVLLTPESRPYVGFHWGGWYFTSNTIPFGWKSSAYIYHSIGLLAFHYFRSFLIPCSLYIDDRHTGEIQLSPKASGYASLSSDADRSFACACSAIFVVCYTLVGLGYFIGLKKSHLVPKQVVPYLGFFGGFCSASLFAYRGEEAKVLVPFTLCS